MGSYKWKKIPIYESATAKEDELKVIKFEKVNRLSNYQLTVYSELAVYKDKFPVQVAQMKSLLDKRKVLVNAN